MAEDPKTRSLLLCVMDGHGEDGDKVSQNIKSKFASYLFKHPDFAGNVKSALTDVIARCEAEILRGINGREGKHQVLERLMTRENDLDGACFHRCHISQ
jgi:hypothetical protein